MTGKFWAAMRHPMQSAWTRAAVLGLILGVLVVAVLVIGTNGPLLTSPNARVATESAAGIHRGDGVTIGSMFGCLNKPGLITIDTIEPVHAVGLRVTGWGLKPHLFRRRGGEPDAAHGGGQIRIERGTLSRLGFTGGSVIYEPCGKHDVTFEFGIHVQKTTAGEAGASGWEVTYTTEGKTKTFVFPVAVRLCNEKLATSEQCQALKV